MSQIDDDYPDIGERRGGMVLVCHGDDGPQEFASWLQPLVAGFRELDLRASDFDVDMDPQDGTDPIVDVTDFCERLGISFDMNMWEGSLISGVYHWGWIKVGTLRSASAHGKKLLRALEAHTDRAIRLAIMRDLQSIKRLDEFIARTADDRHGLREKIASLSSSLHVAESALAVANSRLSNVEERSSTEVDVADEPTGSARP